jgi:opacity protein-like surface antigen
MRSARILRQGAVILASLCLGSAPAAAAELYFGGAAGFSVGTGEASGFDSLTMTTGKGEDDDASPIYGGTLGIAVPLSDVIPWALRFPSFDVPYWPGRHIHVEGSESFRFPGWTTLIEAEAITGRKYDFTTPGINPATPYQAEVNTTSFLGNFRLDVPIQAPMNALFGRLPMLEPVTIYAGGGVGVGWNELDAIDTGLLNRGSEESFDLAYQYGAGVGYAMSDQLHLTLGWRYFDAGEIDVRLDTNPNPGKYSVDIGAHEFMTQLRFHFYRVPFFGRE